MKHKESYIIIAVFLLGGLIKLLSEDDSKPVTTNPPKNQIFEKQQGKNKLGQSLEKTNTRTLVKDNEEKYIWVNKENASNYKSVELLTDKDPALPKPDEVANWPKPGPITKKITRTCIICGGRRQCMVCFGMPVKYRNGIAYYCHGCAGNPGFCKYCQGTGESELVITLNPDGTAVGFDPKTGQMYTAGMADNFTEEERKSVTQRELPEYMDRIVYAPEYVPSDVKPYCARCGEYGSKHVHVKERIK